MTHDVSLIFSVPPTRDERDDVTMGEADSNDSLSSQSEDEEVHVCDKCERRFRNRRNLQRHIGRRTCSKWGHRWIAPDRTQRLVIADLPCSSCEERFPSQLLRSSHQLIHTHPTEVYHNNTCTLQLTHFSPQRLVRDYHMESNERYFDVEKYFFDNIDLLEQMFHVVDDFIVKGLIYATGIYHKIDSKTNEIIDVRENYFISSAATPVDDVSMWLHHHVAGLKERMDAFNERDSGLVFGGICHADIKITLIENYSGQGVFTLPPALKSKTAVINVDTDTQCFKYAVLSILHYNDISKHRQRVSKYRPWENELKFDGIDDIDNVNFKNIKKFEKLNQIKINVHVWEKIYKGVCYNERKSNYDRVVNLLLVHNENDDHWHYCGIPKLERLVSHTRTSNKKFFCCPRCMTQFASQHKFKVHYDWCQTGKLQMVSMPEEQTFQYMENGYELSPVCVIYSDIECYIDPNTKVHKPAAICAMEVWHTSLRDRHPIKQRTWVGEDCVVQYLKFLDSKVHSLKFRESELSRKPMNFTDQDQLEYEQCNECPKCNSTFDKTHAKVRDHCHITGKFRSALCSRCNFRLRLRRRILPVIFHNLKNYDAHILIRNGIGKMSLWDLNVIAQTNEKYMCIMANVPVDKTKTNRPIHFTIKFMDSFQFLASSLATLANNLESLPITQTMKRNYPNVNDNLLKQKGVFPYNYFSSLSILNETALPSRDKFKNDLTGEECTESDYVHAQQAWNDFNCQTFRDFMIAYLKLDVYLLGDVFETFRNKALEEDQLDPVHFVTLPHMSYQSAFKMTKTQIHLLQDFEMFNLFERGIRGGMTFVNKHQIKDKTTDDYKIRIIYIDMNNLYGMALSQPLPHSNFKWIDDDQIEYFSNPQNILAIDDEGETGYTFDVNLKYPDHIKDYTKDFPLAPESGYVTEDMFSPFMKEMNHNLKDKFDSKFSSSRKLLLTQYDKENYVIHYSLLKFFIRMGAIVTKINSGVQYTQKRFFKDYIDYNSKKRAASKNAFDKDYCKYKNNSLFGKTMENVRNRTDYKLTNDEEKVSKLGRSPLFVHRMNIGGDMYGVKMLQAKVKLNKPIFIGQAVLDYSKVSMYELFYNSFKKCPLLQRVELAVGDTDSFILALTMDSKYDLEDIFTYFKPQFDSSNYPQDHPLFSNINKAKLGCFKDECAGKRIKEAILLRPKMYSILLENRENIKRAKGVSKCIVRNMKHELYQKIFQHQRISSVNMTILKSKAHEIKTTTFAKRGLSAWEDKRCWMSANISLPHGHPDTQVPPPKRRKLSLPPSGDVSD